MNKTQQEYYAEGQQDCFDNKMPKNGMPDAYYEGYSDQFSKDLQLIKMGEMA